jgi:hypothetical protein
MGENDNFSISFDRPIKSLLRGGYNGRGDRGTAIKRDRATVT